MSKSKTTMNKSGNYKYSQTKKDCFKQKKNSIQAIQNKYFDFFLPNS